MSVDGGWMVEGEFVVCVVSFLLEVDIGGFWVILGVIISG